MTGVAVADPFAFQAHVDVWVLVAALTGAWVYMVKVVGPDAVAVGQPVVTRRNVIAFVAAMAILWVASDWPIHDIGEGYLYSVHMFQHMMLSYFLPPLVLLATPEWLLRVLIGNGRVYAVLRWLCRPVVAGVIFNVAVIITHIPGVVNASVTSDSAAVHYGLHVMVVLASLLMWMPVCGPFRELQMGTGGKMIYLFLQSVLPTIPAGWLTFAEGTVYEAYDSPVRVWNLSVTDDQQLAGAIMKLGGSTFLWAIIVVLWFKRFASSYHDEHQYRRGRTMPTAEIVGHDEDPLTYDDVQREFARAPAATEPDPAQPDR
ncbi:MAG: cytochrome c oxidase assembly protein [Ilumatobacteraceae bacterium]